jgi:DNA-binding GntR family transcriptional regulator
MQKVTESGGRAWEDAYERIRELILTMRIKPGQSLSENRLAGELGMSRTPVREALNRLEQEGLIISSGRRKRVFVPTIREIEDIFDLKIAIESAAAGWAAARAGERDKEQLAEVVESMSRVAASRPTGDADLEDWHHEWLALDIRYHEILFAMTGNTRAKQITDTLNAYWHRLRLGILAIEDRIEKAEGEHRAIADAVLAGDGDRAAELMRDHLRALKTMLVGIMRAFHYPG